MKPLSLFLSIFILSNSALASGLELTDAVSKRLWQALESGGEKMVSPNERSILGATLALKQNNHQRALSMLDNPESKQDPLANLLKAEAYRRAALAAVSSAGDYAKHQKSSEQQLSAIDLSADLNEANVRLEAFAEKVDGTSGYPFDLLQLNNEISSVFLVDKARSRLFVYQRNSGGALERVANEYVVTGAKGGNKKIRGDARTPNGIYRFTAVRHDEALRAHYGPVVFPIDYPNSLDQLHGKTGDGIWMHGYPEDVKRRPPQDTRGCFALPNPVLKQMEAYVVPGKSWVIIGENLAFDAREQQQQLLASVQSSIESWRNDWQSLNSDHYLSHYHNDFRSGKYNLKSWKRYKRKVNQHKKYIQVELTEMSIVHDPTITAAGETVVAEFVQRYESDNYQDSGRKRLYLARENPQQPWKILIEENLEP